GAARLRDAVAALLREGTLPLRRRRATRTGRVDLVGGGPGPIDLMTVRGRRLLAEADVVIADRLGPADELPAVLDPDVEIIDVGKRPGHHPVPQEQINELLITHARRGKRVVRLKGGDPFVFGRGGEELAACLAAGIAVEVVPGITSAIAVPQAAGIPVTHRGVSAGVHVVNGQAEITPTTLAALVDEAMTTVVLMGVAALPRLAAAALAAGADGDRPLATVAQRAAAAGVRNPAVIVIGDVTRADLLLGASAGERIGEARR
ncbi:MAG: uroporphyrinogen-III C-methyltransferase, partial [Microbacterium hominis]|nr:uroporphyrinogen-III C-methyltransferase [Microbacterium hominis]